MNHGTRAIRVGLVVSLTVVTVIAVGISYGHLYDLARENGETGLAAGAGPVTVDGLILTCSLVIVRAARERSRQPVLAWLMLLAGIGATLAGNVAHGLAHGWPGALVAGWPAVVAAGCFHLVVGELRGGRVEPGTAAVAALSPWPLPDLGAAGQPVDGYALWDEIEADPGPVATSAPGLSPVLPEDEDERGNDGPSTDPLPSESGSVDPDLAPVVATARDRYAEVLATGAVPSVRRIRRELRVGHPKAVAVRQALTEQ